MRCLPLAIVKLFYARRNPDSTQKKQILAASATIADIMVEHLKYDIKGMPFALEVVLLFTALVGDRVCCLDYHSVMLNLVTILLVDGICLSLLLVSLSLMHYRADNQPHSSYSAATCLSACEGLGRHFQGLQTLH